MFKRSAFVALGLVLASALPALAETSVTTVALGAQTPNPSIIGQSVTLDITVTQLDNPANACSGTADIVDTTGGGSVAVCTGVAINGPAGGPATGTCNYGFPTLGARTLSLSYSGVAGVCAAATAAASQTVNATSVPTLDEWALWTLAGLMLLGGTAMVARRSQRTRA